MSNSILCLTILTDLVVYGSVSVLSAARLGLGAVILGPQRDGVSVTVWALVYGSSGPPETSAG